MRHAICCFLFSAARRLLIILIRHYLSSCRRSLINLIPRIMPPPLRRCYAGLFCVLLLGIPPGTRQKNAHLAATKQRAFTLFINSREAMIMTMAILTEYVKGMTLKRKVENCARMRYRSLKNLLLKIKT